MLEFCSRGTLESNLRDNIKSEQMFLKKKKMQLANEIAKGMRHLSDARVNSLLVFENMQYYFEKKLKKRPIWGFMGEHAKNPFLFVIFRKR